MCFTPTTKGKGAIAVDDQPKSVGVGTLTCMECECHWTDPRERWRVYMTEDDPPAVLLYCDACAEREFGV
jgi:hypothetical protein